MAVNMVIMFGRIGVVFGNLIIPVLDRISCELPYMTLSMFNFCKKTNIIFYFYNGRYNTKNMIFNSIKTNFSACLVVILILMRIKKEKPKTITTP